MLWLGTVTNTYVVVGVRAGQMQVRWQQWGPWLLACTTMAAESCHRCTAVEVGEGVRLGACRGTAGGASCR